MRTGDLLFAAFTQDDAYLIDILPHDNWTNLDLLRVVVRNWPTAGIVHPIKGLGLQTPITDDDRKNLRNAGIAGLVEIDGNLFVPAGQTTAGTPIRVTLHVNRVLSILNQLDSLFDSDPQWLEDVLRGASIDVTSQDHWEPDVRGDVFGFIEQGRQIFYSIGQLTV